MTDKLIDIIVYAYDTSEKEKHNISKDIIKQIWKRGGSIVCLLKSYGIFCFCRAKHIMSLNEAK